MIILSKIILGNGWDRFPEDALDMTGRGAMEILLRFDLPIETRRFF